jgi:protein SCO1/2
MSNVSGKSIIWIALSAFVVMALAILALVVTNKADLSRRDLPVLGKVPSFTFTDQNNQPFTVDSLNGKLSVVAFIFTRCPGECPIMMRQYQNLYQGFSSSSNIRFIGITVDPDYDSVTVLKRYSDSLGIVSPAGRFLWSTLDSIGSLMEGGFKLTADGLPGGHSTKLILVDGNAEIRGYYDGLDDASVDILKAQLRELVKLYP